ncbi:MAG: hypothetical protein WA615_07380 [Bradyrhizobium sp.]
MTMNTFSQSRTFSLASIIPWLLNLATRMLARILNMPEPLVHNTGVFVFAHVQTIENSVGKTLCPMRLLRQLRNRRRQSSR